MRKSGRKYAMLFKAKFSVRTSPPRLETSGVISTVQNDESIDPIPLEVNRHFSSLLNVGASAGALMSRTPPAFKTLCICLAATAGSRK